MLNTNTKPNFEALSSLLPYHIEKKNDINKWMILNKFLKSINTIVSQLSQANTTSKQVEKLLMDH